MKKILFMSFLIIAAIVLGSLLGNACADADALSWLAHSVNFAFEPGQFINFEILRISFGVSFSANVAQIILILVGIFMYIKFVPKLVPSK